MITTKEKFDEVAKATIDELVDDAIEQGMSPKLLTVLGLTTSLVLGTLKSKLFDEDEELMFNE